MGYGNNAAVLAYTQYLTPTGYTTPTLQLFTSAWDGANWSVPVQRTNDKLGHHNPQVVYNAANQPLLIWQAGDELRLHNLTTSETATLPLDIQAAIAAPRISFSEPNLLMLEEALPEGVMEGLADRGHTIARTQSLGNAHGLTVEWGPDGRPRGFTGGADPRGTGLAKGR